MRKGLILAVFLASGIAFGQSTNGKFDGTWNTTVNCDAKGNAQGYTWHFVSTVTGNVLHGERGMKDAEGYLSIDGTIEKDGKAKLTANGVTAGAQYTHGPFKSEGASYSYEIKSEFTDAQGKGERSQGLGIIGRPCHYVFERQAAK